MSPVAAGVAPRVKFGSLADDYREKRAAIDAAVARVLKRGRFILGEEVARFEESFAEFLGVGHVVGCANGTEAIALALQAAGARAADEVILPANTCVPTLAAVRLSGARPRLADVDPASLTLDARNAARVRTPATKFLLPVHLYGGVADLEGLQALARSEGLALVEDCAQSHGASLDGRPTGGFGRAAAFSFYPSKNLGAYGDGGAVATNDAEIAARLRQLRQYGWDRRDYAEREGWNSRLDELQAAILTAKLSWLARENVRRREIGVRYDAAFRDLPLRLLAVRPGTLSARHLYPVFSDRRDALREHLASRGIETGFHYPFPLHLQPAYAFLGYRKGDFPVSETACETELSLPMYPTLSDQKVKAVISAVLEFFGEEGVSRELVSVVVPVYFNSASLPRLAERLKAVEDAADHDLEVIFVDDGSGDESWERIQEIARGWPAARGVRLTRNFGSQMAILAGLADTKGQAAAVLSADLQEPPELLPGLVAAWRKGATAVLAARRSRPEGLPTRAAAGMYYAMLRRLAFSQMPSGGFDCFLIGRPAIDFLVENREIHTSLPGLLLWGGFPTALVPYDRVAREDGESRWTLGKKLKYFIDSVISFSYAPLRWMSVAGAVLALLAFAYAVFLITYKVVQGQPIQGWTSLMVALAFFSGVQLLSLGILGEYLWRTLDAARARKGFLVRERTE